jgi:hypothetical protein
MFGEIGVDLLLMVGAVWFDDFSPPGTNDDVKAPDFWTKGTFLIMAVNNEAYYDCKAE